MNVHDLADHIIVYAAFAFAGYWLMAMLSALVSAVDNALARRRREVLHRRWVAARVAARESTEARMKAMGYWDNYEIQDAMNAAGKAVDPRNPRNR